MANSSQERAKGKGRTWSERDRSGEALQIQEENKM